MSDQSEYLKLQVGSILKHDRLPCIALWCRLLIQSDFNNNCFMTCPNKYTTIALAIMNYIPIMAIWKLWSEILRGLVVKIPEADNLRIWSSKGK